MTAARPLAWRSSGRLPLQAEQPSVRGGNERLRAGDPGGGPRRATTPPRRRPVPTRRSTSTAATPSTRRGSRARRGRPGARRPRPTPGRAARLAGPCRTPAARSTPAGDQEGAIRAFAEALRRDPTNEDARYNLEVAAAAQGGREPKDSGRARSRSSRGRRSPRRTRRSRARRRSRSSRRTGSRTQPAAAAAGQQEPQDAGRAAGEAPGRTAKDDARRSGQEEPGRRRAGAAGAGRASAGRAGPTPVGKQDAERLLDALRSRERSMPLAGGARGRTRGGGMSRRTGSLLLAAALLLGRAGGGAGGRWPCRPRSTATSWPPTRRWCWRSQVEAEPSRPVSLPDAAASTSRWSRAGSSRQHHRRPGRRRRACASARPSSSSSGCAPRRAGDLTIPAARGGGRRGQRRDRAHPVKVLPAGQRRRAARPAQPRRPARRPALRRAPGGPAARARRAAGRAWNGWERDLKLVVELDKREVFLGEQVTASLWLLSPVGVVETGGLQAPDATTASGPSSSRCRSSRPSRCARWTACRPAPTCCSGWRSSPPAPASWSSAASPIAARCVRVARRRPLRPVPRRAPGERRRSAPVALTVKPLPAGAPAGFDGVNVGTMALSATLSSPRSPRRRPAGDAPAHRPGRGEREGLGARRPPPRWPASRPSPRPPPTRWRRSRGELAGQPHRRGGAGAGAAGQLHRAGAALADLRPEGRRLPDPHHRAAHRWRCRRPARPGPAPAPRPRPAATPSPRGSARSARPARSRAAAIRPGRGLPFWLLVGAPVAALRRPDRLGSAPRAPRRRRRGPAGPAGRPDGAPAARRGRAAGGRRRRRRRSTWSWSGRCRATAATSWATRPPA